MLRGGGTEATIVMLPSSSLEGGIRQLERTMEPLYVRCTKKGFLSQVVESSELSHQKPLFCLYIAHGILENIDCWATTVVTNINHFSFKKEVSQWLHFSPVLMKFYLKKNKRAVGVD